MCCAKLKIKCWNSNSNENLPSLTSLFIYNTRRRSFQFKFNFLWCCGRVHVLQMSYHIHIQYYKGRRKNRENIAFPVSYENRKILHINWYENILQEISNRMKYVQIVLTHSKCEMEPCGCQNHSCYLPIIYSLDPLSIETFPERTIFFQWWMLDWTEFITKNFKKKL
jgi:hypothetical protein